MRRIALLLLVSALFAEYPGQPGVIYYDSVNYWNMDAGSLVTNRVKLDLMKSKRVETSAGEFGLLSSSLNSEFQLRKGMVTFRFDDGYKDAVDSAAPLLASYGYRGIASIIADIPSKNIEGYMNWEDLRQLSEEFGWEICSHSYQHRRYYDNWTEVWNDIVVSKRILEDSIGCPVNTFVMPFGYDSVLGYYLIRSFYNAALWAEPQIGDSLMKPPFDPFHLGGYFIPDDSASIDSLIKTVADSGWWYITLIHDASSCMEKIRWLLDAVERYHVEVVTIIEGLERINSTTALGPIKIVSDMQATPNWSVARLLREDLINFAGRNWDFRDWSKGQPLYWLVEFTNPEDSMFPKDLDEGIAGVGNVNIPGKSLCISLASQNDTVWITKEFVAPSTDTAKLEIYWNYWFGAVGAWQLKDSIGGLYWDATHSLWTSTEVWNEVSESYYPGDYLYLFEEWLNLPDSSFYRFTVRAHNLLSDTLILRLAAFQLFPTCKPTSPSILLEFKTPFQGWNITVKSSLDFIWDNGVGPVLTSPGGYKYRLIVDDSGKLTTEPVP